MKLEFLEKSVQFDYKNEEKYGKNGKKRIYGNVKQDADPASLVKVGEALSRLQGDELNASCVITKEAIKNN